VCVFAFWLEPKKSLNGVSIWVIFDICDVRSKFYELIYCLIFRIGWAVIVLSLSVIAIISEGSQYDPNYNTSQIKQGYSKTYGSDVNVIFETITTETNNH